MIPTIKPHMVKVNWQCIIKCINKYSDKNAWNASSFLDESVGWACFFLTRALVIKGRFEPLRVAIAIIDSFTTMIIEYLINCLCPDKSAQLGLNNI